MIQIFVPFRVEYCYKPEIYF